MSAFNHLSSMASQLPDSGNIADLYIDSKLSVSAEDTCIDHIALTMPDDPGAQAANITTSPPPPFLRATDILLISLGILITALVISALIYDTVSSKAFRCNHPTLTAIVTFLYALIVGTGLTSLYANFVPVEWVPKEESRTCIAGCCYLILSLPAQAAFRTRLQDCQC
jgi:hypothetical protein